MSGKLTQEQVAAYVKASGAACPYCGSQQIEGGNVQVDCGGAQQEITCNHCRAQWTDAYTLDGVGCGDGDDFDFVPATSTPSPGAIRAAEYFDTRPGRETIDGIARMIDDLTAGPELVEACEILISGATEAIHRMNDTGLSAPADLGLGSEKGRAAIAKAKKGQ